MATAAVAYNREPRHPGPRGDRGDRKNQDDRGDRGERGERRAGDFKEFDSRQWDEKVAEIKKEVEVLKSKKGKINDDIEGKSAGKAEYHSARDELRAVMTELEETITTLMEKKSKISKQIDETSAQGKELEREVKNMRSKFEFKTEADIDKEIMRIDYSMTTSSLTLKEEKKQMARIKELKNSKPALSNANKLESNINADSTIPLTEQVKHINEAIKEARDKRTVQRDRFSKLVDKRKEATEGVPELIEERSVVETAMRELVLKMKGIENEKYAKKREFQQHISELKAVRAEKFRAEKVQREKEKKRKDLERELERAEADIPMEQEVQLTEQAILYVKRMISKNEKTPDASAPSEAVAAPSVEGATMLKPKHERDEEYLVAPKTKKKNRKNVKEEKSNKITHDVGTLTHFQSLDLNPPMSHEEAPACLESLEKKLVEFKEQQKGAVGLVEQKRAEIKALLIALDKPEEEEGEEAPAADDAENAAPAAEGE